MPSGPKKRRAARKKNDGDASFTHLTADVKVDADAELSEITVSNVSEVNTVNVQAEAKPEICLKKDAGKESECVDEQTYIKISAIEQTMVNQNLTNCSQMSFGGDVNAQPVSEMSSNENKGNESSESADNQNTFQEVLNEASSNKIERNNTCESVVNDEVKLQESLIKTTKKAERNVPFESVDHQISLHKSVTGPTSYETEKNELPILVNRLNFLQESLVKSTSNETEGNEEGNVGKSSYHPTTMANLVESNVADGDQISSESALKDVSITPSSTIPPAENKVAADVELFEGVSNASEYNVGDMLAEAVSEMCLSKNGGSESNKSVSQKLLIKTISNTVETKESSESVITVESVLEETRVETTSKIAEAYDPSKLVDEKSVIEEPLVELPRRSQRNKKPLSYLKDYYLSPQVKPKRK